MYRATPAPQDGFTLIEVLVSVVIISIGLLGIAKMESVALSSTGVAQQRSIAAMEAASLAASMHGDRVYWDSAAAPSSFTITGTAISNTTLATTVDCVSGDTGNSAPCTPAELAAYDLQQWAKNVNGAPSYNNPSKPNGTPSPLPLSPALPFQVTTVACTTSVTAATSCTIQIAWGENAVALNTQGANASAASAASGFNVPTYTLYVQP
jgi:type IV pilus assembly protein PilV